MLELVDLHKIIAARDKVKLQVVVASELQADLVELVIKLEFAEQIRFFILLTDDVQRAMLFSELPLELQEQLITKMSRTAVRGIISNLHADDIADLVETIADHEVKKIVLGAIDSPTTEENVAQILRFDESQTGSIMDVDIPLLKENWTVSRALKVIREYTKNRAYSQFYVVQIGTRKLMGYVTLNDLVFNAGTTRINKFVHPSPAISASSQKEEASREFARHDLPTLPVINSQNEIIGVISADEVLDVVEQAATEDVQKAAGIIAYDEAYSKASIFRLFRSRVFWLLLLMISSTLSQIVLDAFQSLADTKLSSPSSIVISSGITSAMVAILPVISGAAGNAGSQSSSTIIRALATGDISRRDYLLVFGKEIGSSTLIGLTLAGANFLRLIIYYSVTDALPTRLIVLAAAASVSLFIVILLANIVGGLLPLLAKTIKLDPAVMAAPLLTTIIDAISIAIFFSISIGVMILYI